MITITAGGGRRGTNPTAPSPAAAPAGGLFAALRREWAYWQARRRLDAMDEEGLHDLGLGRGEIEDAVRHGRGSSA